MYVQICHLKRIFTSYYDKYEKNRYKTIQYNLQVKNINRKTLLITVAGIALKGQADLISIMVPSEVLV